MTGHRLVDADLLAAGIGLHRHAAAAGDADEIVPGQEDSSSPAAMSPALIVRLAKSGESPTVAEWAEARQRRMIPMLLSSATACALATLAMAAVVHDDDAIIIRFGGTSPAPWSFYDGLPRNRAQRAVERDRCRRNAREDAAAGTG